MLNELREKKMELNEKAKNELDKISQLSSKNAADALSQMLNKKVEIKFPSITLKPFEEVKKLTGEMIISICELAGDVRGNILFAFPKKEGLKMLDILMMQEPGTLKDMNEESTGAFNELNNIVGGAYVSAFANYLQFKIFPNPPKFIGDLKSIEKELMGELNEAADNILLIDTILDVESVDANGLFFMLLDDESLKKLLALLEKK